MAAAAISTALYMFVSGGINKVPEASLVKVIETFDMDRDYMISHGSNPDISNKHP
jgi:hypothetical protein